VHERWVLRVRPRAKDDAGERTVVVGVVRDERQVRLRERELEAVVEAILKVAG
jgi:hypothetical protein